MNTLFTTARATAPAWKSFALFVALLLASSDTLEARQHRRSGQPVTGPTVTVTPITAWKTIHPSCTVHAITDDCGVTPEAWTTGTDCYPTSGCVDMAHVVVEDPGDNCTHTYLVRANDGIVEVVMIDP